MKITQWNKENCRAVAESMKAAFAEIEKKHGVKITYGGGSYEPSSIYKPKIEISIVATDGTAQTEQVRDFKIFAQLHGVDSEALGKEFSFNGSRYLLTGMKPKKANPFICQKVGTGKFYCFPESVISKAFPAPINVPA